VASTAGSMIWTKKKWHYGAVNEQIQRHAARQHIDVHHIRIHRITLKTGMSFYDNHRLSQVVFLTPSQILSEQYRRKKGYIMMI
jgi:hypothetical protein